MYDALVIGARCAGAPTAMLLARKGYRVLLVDRASFPSDHISTHLIRLPGLSLLKRWGLLEKVTALNCPPIPNVRLDWDAYFLYGSPPPFDGIAAEYCPRRTVLDKLLVDAAVEAGVELREGFFVEELSLEDGRVTGAYGRLYGGIREKLQARIIIGADGLYSFVARSVQAPMYNVRPPTTCGYYAYWSGVPVSDFEIYIRERRIIGICPTNDSLSMLYIAWPHGEFAQVRADIEANFLQSLDLVPELAARVRGGKREGGFKGTGDMLNFFRRPYGPGWALVGDAGYHKDVITAYGITDAFRGADLLAEALDAGFSERQPMDEALAGYEQRRNEVAFPLYDLTAQFASLEQNSPEQEQFYRALGCNPVETSRFLGVIEGTVPIPDFFDPANMARIMGQSS